MFRNVFTTIIFIYLVSSAIPSINEESKLFANGDSIGNSVTSSGDSSKKNLGETVGNDSGSGAARSFYGGDDDGDGVPNSDDNCILFNPDQTDCNANGVGDVCDIAFQLSFDCDQNGVPDECQPDCDGDGWIDPCDSEGDCDGNGIPDNCDTDCDGNGIPDSCEVNLETKLLAIDGAEHDLFGTSVCISSEGANIIVGAPNDDENGNLSGSAYVYTLIGGTWQETKLLASDGTNDDRFGTSVSISRIGTTAIVGAYRHDENGSNSGAAYIYSFVDGVWEEKKLLASDGVAGDHYGTTVAISGDGNTAVVGSDTNGDGLNGTGAVYIYKLVDGNWEETKLLASDGVDADKFGVSVSIASVGTVAIVGALGVDDNGSTSGSAYIYELVDGLWQETKLLASDGASGDSFGRSVSIASDGNIVIVGSQGDDDNGDNSGSAYIYKRVGGNWQETKLLASDGADSDRFGTSVSISSASSNAVAIVGAQSTVDNGIGSGSAYLYKLEDGIWQETKLLASDGSSYSSFGCSVSIASAHSPAVIGAYRDNGNDLYYAGSAYVYASPFISADDCNSNDIPDECDINNGTSNDANSDGVPDECQCIADITGDSIVDFNDILVILGFWGTAGPTGDLNGDGVVDVHDLLVLIAAWGACP